MDNAKLKRDNLLSGYKAAVEEWIVAIRNEEALVSADPSVAELDKWERAHFVEDAIRKKVKTAKGQYEDALRSNLFGF
jgi:hypothetical protein